MIGLPHRHRLDLIEADQEVGAHKATPRNAGEKCERPRAWPQPRESNAGTPQPTAELLRRHVKLFPRGDKLSATRILRSDCRGVVNGIIKSDDVPILPVENVRTLSVTSGRARLPPSPRGPIQEGSSMPRRRSLASQVEDARRRAPKVGASAPQTLSGSNAR